MVGGADAGGVDDYVSVAFAGADEEDYAASAGDFEDDFGGAAEVGEGGFEGDDVDSFSYAEDVGAV